MRDQLPEAAIAAAQAAQAAQAGLVVQPAPVDQTIMVSQGEYDGRGVVILQVCSATGTQVTFMPPAVAEQIAARLLEGARSAATGLTVIEHGSRMPTIKGRG
jgi:siroheme synthase